MTENKKHLSYSSYSTYVTCPRKYEIEKVEMLQPEYGTYALVFGSSFDKGSNELLESGNKKKALALAAKEMLRMFSEKTSFESSDFDGEIFTSLTNKALMQKLRQTGWKGDNPIALADSLFSMVSMDEKLSKNQVRALKYLVYFSGIEKLSLMLDAFEEYILPKINEVVSVQTKVKRGILDFQAKIKGFKGVVTCDNKTTSRDYPEDAVLKSVQLAGYGGEIGAYIVFNKNVKKNRTKECKACKKNGTGQRHKTCDAIINGVRCNGEWLETVTPEVIPQFIIDEIPEHNRIMVEQAYQDVEKLIDTKVFPRNLNACDYQFGKPCPYKNYCWNNDKSGLKKKEN